MMRKLDYFHTKKDADEPDPPGSDIRDGPNALDTQQEEWLLKTEPLQGGSSEME